MPCFIFNRKLKIRDSVYYPDVFVTCSPATHPQYETDAAWVIEVLSDSIEDHDRREKASAYAHLPSLRAYLLVHPEMEYVKVGRYDEDGWRWYQYGPSSTMDLDGTFLDLSVIFAEVRETRTSP